MSTTLQEARPLKNKDKSRISRVSDALHRLAPQAHERVVQAGSVLRETAGQMKEHPIQTTQDLLEKSRQERLRVEAENAARPRWRRAFDTTLGKGAKTAIEMLPSPVGYGPGDVVTLLNAIRGKDTFSGAKLDKVDRTINLIAALIPGLPATPVIEVARKVRKKTEDTSYRRNMHRAEQEQQHHPQHPAGPPRHY